MRIREAELGDEEIIAEDFWLPLGKEMEQYSELNILKDCAEEDALKGFRGYLADDKHRIFLLDETHKNIGFMVVEIGERSSRKHGKYLSVTDLFVKANYRSNGHGSKLIEHARKVAEKEDCDFIQVSVEWKNERAREFYEEQGFEEKQVKYVQKLD